MISTRRNVAETLVHHVGVLTISCVLASALAVVAAGFLFNGFWGGLGTILAAPLGFVVVTFYLWIALPMTYLLAPFWWAATKAGLLGQFAALALTPPIVFLVARAWHPEPSAWESAALSSILVTATAALYYALDQRFGVR